MRSALEVCREFDGAGGRDRVGDLGGSSGRLAADRGRLRVLIHLLDHAGSGSLPHHAKSHRQ